MRHSPNLFSRLIVILSLSIVLLGSSLYWLTVGLAVPRLSAAAVAGVNADDNYTTTEDIPLMVGAAGVLSNDIGLTSAFPAAAPLNGVVTIQQDGGFTYVPAANYFGVDQFTYLAVDGELPDLTAYWSFDNGSEPVVDYSGQGNSGHFNGDPTFVASTVPVTRDMGLALDFDGSADYVVIEGDESVYDLNVLSVAFWVKITTFNKNWQSMVTKGDSAWRVHRCRDMDTIAFGTSGLDNEDLCGSVSINDSQWHHVAAVFDGTTKYIYIDGNLDVSAPVTGTVAQNDLPVMLGENGQTFGRSLNGQLDDVRIYDFALTAEEVQEIMISDPFTNTYETSVVTIDIASAPDQPEANDDYYVIGFNEDLFVDDPGVLANDSDLDGDLLSAVLITQPVGGSVLLANSGAFDFTPESDFCGVTQFTYYASDPILDSEPAEVTLNIRCANAPTTMTDVYTTEEDVPLVVPAAGVISNDAGVVGVYPSQRPVHGELDLVQTGAFVYTPTTGYIGADRFDYLAASGSLPAVGYWPFDDQNLVATADESGLQHDLTLDSVMTFATNITETVGRGIVLDLNGGQAVAAGETADFEMHEFTIAFWLKVESWNDFWADLIQNSPVTIRRLSNTNQLAFITSSNANEFLFTFSDIADGQWHHLAFTYDGTTNAIYVDGSLDNIGPVSGNLDYDNMTILIGSAGFEGQMDDLRIYPLVLEQEDIQNAMMGQLPDLMGKETVSITVEMADKVVFLPLVQR